MRDDWGLVRGLYIFRVICKQILFLVHDPCFFFVCLFFFCECAKSSWLFHTFWLAKHETMLAGDNSLINIEASIL